MSYSLDFRQKVLSMREKEGLSIRATAQRFGIGSSSITRWLKRMTPKTVSSRRRKSDKDALLKDVQQYPDAYQRERAARFGVCHQAIGQAGHLIEYLPPYSADLNPVEHKWAQAKSKRREIHCDVDTLFSEHIL